MICAIHLQCNLLIYSYKYIYTKNDYEKNYLHLMTLTNGLNHEPVSKHYMGLYSTICMFYQSLSLKSLRSPIDNMHSKTFN